MNECESLGGMVFLLFVGGLGALVYFIVHNIEKPNNAQPEPSDKKTCGVDAHIGSKVCVERRIEETGKRSGYGFMEYDYKAEIGTIVGKKVETYSGPYPDRCIFWLVQFEDGKTEKYRGNEVYTEYSEELVKAKKPEKQSKKGKKQ